MEQNTKTTSFNKKKRRNWWPFIFLCVLIYALLQLYLIGANKIETVRALEGSLNDSIIAQGIVCREETLLTKEFDGIIDYQVQDGQRLSKGMLIGQVYPSYRDLEILSIIQTLDQRLDDLKTAENYSNTGNFDVSVTRKNINNNIAKLSSMYTVKNYQQIGEILTELTLNLNKISAATGKDSDFSQAEAEILQSLATLKEQISNPTGTLYAPQAGYFISYVDGYEDLAKVENFSSRSYEEGMQLLNTPPDKSAVQHAYGKLISDYKWSICAYVNSEDTQALAKGKQVKVALSSMSSDFQTATVKSVTDLGEKSLVVLECSVMNLTAATTRIADCEILFKQYTGIKIPKSALRMEDGQMGVYVKFSQLVQFKKITPLFENENYIIVSAKNTENNQLKLYDEIIVKGRNLYDGKYL